MRTYQLSEQARKRLTAGEMIIKGFDNDEIVDLLECSTTSVRRWRKRMGKENDLNRLSRQRGSGRPTMLSDEQSEELLEILKQGATAAGYAAERWTSPIVADLIRERFHINYSPRSVRYWMKEHGMSYQMPVVYAEKYDAEAVLEFASRRWKKLKKKAAKLGIPLVFVDESGFSLAPIRGKTWSKIGEPVTLRENFSRQNHTGIGMITLSPNRKDLHFYFTIFCGSARTEDFIFWLTQLHYYYSGQRVMILWDGLSAHKAAENYFKAHYSNWFFFEYFPPYSPELNPVEQCWQWMKNVDLANVISPNVAELHKSVLNSAEKINQKKSLLKNFLEHAKLLL
jgi:transposase